MYDKSITAANTRTRSLVAVPSVRAPVSLRTASGITRLTAEDPSKARTVNINAPLYGAAIFKYLFISFNLSTPKNHINYFIFFLSLFQELF